VEWKVTTQFNPSQPGTYLPVSSFISETAQGLLSVAQPSSGCAKQGWQLRGAMRLVRRRDKGASAHHLSESRTFLDKTY
jgi:hypothetical protein